MIRGRFNFISKIFYFLAFIFLFSCQKKEKNYFEAIASNDVKLSDPEPHEWRYNRNEKFQTFEGFQKSKKIHPEIGKNTIYLQPIGEFNILQKKQVELAGNYFKIYFQLETKILPALPNTIFPKDIRRIKDENEQILAGYVLDSILIKRKPKDALVLMGITEKDLFPRSDWNYIFGLASYKIGVGVTSMYRFSNGNVTKANFNRSLERLLKVGSHEIGHMFGISHCLNANCVMNGSNHLSETDYHFARACSLCQQKLNSSLHYDNKKRLNELKNFFEKHHLNSEVTRAEEDLKLIK
ncbi:archaemetzincin [Chryseobacterium arachidis]|uniref:Archaemetzincin n=2 Tax=Chryseobacterium arachidis TaxID=1416778 RepID=A0A1M5CV14_9FLAO|nr:archaemetzincin [Chryseobacterium arachidis]SHF58476.1 archaemetzincin [Chryseobacterium arachidis]